MAEAGSPAPPSTAAREVEGVLVETFALTGLVAVTPRRFGDARGYFCETWSRRRYAGFGNASGKKREHT